MRMSVDHERLVRMLKESISLMCKSSLNYDMELNVEGLLGITLDKKDVVLVNINESFQTPQALRPPSPERPSPGQKRRQQDVIEIKEEEEGGSPPSCARKKRNRRRSRDSTDAQQIEQFSLGYHKDSPSQAGLEQSSHRDSSREGVPLHGAMDTQSSGMSGAASVKEDSGDLDFSDIVIKQELGDDNNTNRVEDFSFSEEGFEGQHALTDPAYVGQQGSNLPQMASGFPTASTSAEDGSQSRHRTSVWPRGTGQGPSAGAVQTESGATVYPCRYCSVTLFSSTARYDHERAHTGKGFGCFHCGKMFSSNWKLQRHQDSVHRKKTYICEKCQKVFTNPASIIRHNKHDCSQSSLAIEEKK